MSYTPTGIAGRAVEHLRTLPPGAELPSHELSEALEYPGASVSAALHYAASHGWLRCRREGRHAWWQLGPSALGQVQDIPEATTDDPLPVRQTIVPMSAWCASSAAPEPQEPPPREPHKPAPASRIACGRSVRLTIAASRGLLIRDGVAVHLSDAQTAFLLAAIDGVGAPS